MNSHHSARLLQDLDAFSKWVAEKTVTASDPTWLSYTDLDPKTNAHEVCTCVCMHAYKLLSI